MITINNLAENRIRLNSPSIYPYYLIEFKNRATGAVKVAIFENYELSKLKTRISIHAVHPTEENLILGYVAFENIGVYDVRVFGQNDNWNTNTTLATYLFSDGLTVFPNTQVLANDDSFKGAIPYGGVKTFTCEEVANCEVFQWVVEEVAKKQDALVSGVNIKTINGASLLGSGDLFIDTSGGGGGGGNVDSVNGKTGDVMLDTDDVPEGGTNLYFTDARAQAAVTGMPVSTFLNDAGYITSLPTSTKIYVDANYTGVGNGSLLEPFTTLQDALDYCVNNSITGSVIWLRRGDYTHNTDLNTGNHIFCEKDARITYTGTDYHAWTASNGACNIYGYGSFETNIAWMSSYFLIDDGSERIIEGEYMDFSFSVAILITNGALLLKNFWRGINVASTVVNLTGNSAYIHAYNCKVKYAISFIENTSGILSELRIKDCILDISFGLGIYSNTTYVYANNCRYTGTFLALNTHVPFIYLSDIIAENSTALLIDPNSTAINVHAIGCSTGLQVDFSFITFSGDTPKLLNNSPAYVYTESRDSVAAINFFETGVDVTAPNDGDLWRNTDRLKIMVGAAQEVFAYLSDIYPTVTDTNIIADNYKWYHNNGVVEYTDPTTLITGIGFIVFIVNGSATIGGIPYSTKGSLVVRVYDGTAWQTYEIGAGKKKEINLLNKPLLNIYAQQNFI